MRPPIEIEEALKKLFPACSVGLYEQRGAIVANINAASGESVYLRYQDMPKIAEAFGTERLDFQSIAGADYLDSYTFDGVLLNISGRD